MQTIYKNATYIFYITIKVNDLPVDIRNDVVRVYLSKISSTAPVLTKTADVTTDGLTGKAAVEFTATETNGLTIGNLKLQAVWELDGSTRKFVVIDTTVKVKSRIS